MLETAVEEAREKGFNEGKLQAGGPSSARTSQSVMEEVSSVCEVHQFMFMKTLVVCYTLP